MQNLQDKTATQTVYSTFTLSAQNLRLLLDFSSNVTSKHSTLKSVKVKANNYFSNLLKPTDVTFFPLFLAVCIILY